MTFTGSLISSDSIHYGPTGTWQVSFDWLDQEPYGSHSYSYSGTASTDINSGDSHIVEVLPTSLGYLTLDTGSNSFSGAPMAQVATTVPEGGGLQGWAPCNALDTHPLSGSDASGDATCSWTFTPNVASPPPPPPNNPPTANAGPDQSVNSGDTVTLDGSGSSNPDPGDSVVSYQWSSSDSSISLNGATSPNPTFTAPNVDMDTTYTIQLIVTDTHGAQSQPDTVDVLVKAPPPCPVTNTAAPAPTTTSALKTNTALPPPTTTVSVDHQKYQFK